MISAGQLGATLTLCTMAQAFFVGSEIALSAANRGRLAQAKPTSCPFASATTRHSLEADRFTFSTSRPSFASENGMSAKIVFRWCQRTRFLMSSQSLSSGSRITTLLFRAPFATGSRPGMLPLS